MRNTKNKSKASLMGNIPENLTMVNSIQKVASLCLNVWNKETINQKESLYVFYLTSQLKVVNCELMAVGTETTCYVDIDAIIANTHKNGVRRIVIAHNHPNGTLKPSDKDLDVTNKLSIRCALEGIELVEHIIITPSQQFFSFANEGLIEQYAERNKCLLDYQVESYSALAFKVVDKAVKQLTKKYNSLAVMDELQRNVEKLYIKFYDPII